MEIFCLSFLSWLKGANRIYYTVRYLNWCNQLFSQKPNNECIYKMPACCIVFTVLFKPDLKNTKNKYENIEIWDPTNNVEIIVNGNCPKNPYFSFENSHDRRIGKRERGKYLSKGLVYQFYIFQWNQFSRWFIKKNCKFKIFRNSPVIFYYVLFSVGVIFFQNLLFDLFLFLSILSY